MKRTVLAITAVLAVTAPLLATAPAQAASRAVVCQVDTVAPYEYKIDYLKAIIDVACRNSPELVMLRARLFEAVPATRSRGAYLKPAGRWAEDSNRRTAAVYPTGLCSGGKDAVYVAYWEALAWPPSDSTNPDNGWTKAGTTIPKSIDCSDKRFGKPGPERRETTAENKGITNYPRGAGVWMIPGQKQPPCDKRGWNQRVTCGRW